jgi:hypothetical protein
MLSDETHVLCGTHVSFEEEDLIDELLLFEILNSLFYLCFVLERNEAINVFFYDYAVESGIVYKYGVQTRDNNYRRSAIIKDSISPNATSTNSKSIYNKT